MQASARLQLAHRKAYNPLEARGVLLLISLMDILKAGEAVHASFLFMLVKWFEDQTSFLCVRKCL